MKCPKCGSTRIIIHEKREYTQYWTIDGNNLYKTRKDSCSKAGEIWIYCDECLQNERKTEYKLTEEQASKISWLFVEARSADITEFMEKDFDWRIDDEEPSANDDGKTKI